MDEISESRAPHPCPGESRLPRHPSPRRHPGANPHRRM